MSFYGLICVIWKPPAATDALKQFIVAVCWIPKDASKSDTLVQDSLRDWDWPLLTVRDLCVHAARKVEQPAVYHLLEILL